MVTTVDSKATLGASDTYLERVGKDLRLKDATHGTATTLSELTSSRRIFTLNLDPGKETIYFKSPAPESISRIGGVNSGTAIAVLGFDADIEEFIVYNIQLPSDLDPSGTVNFRFQWLPATNSSSNVVWKIYHAAIDSTKSLDSALSTLTVVSAGSATANTLSEAVISSSTGSLGWSPGDNVIIHISRDATNASDTLTIDAHLAGLAIELPLKTGTANGGTLVTVKNQGTAVSGGPFAAANFIGSTVNATVSAGQANVAISGGGSPAPIGTLAYGSTSPDATYFAANGQALSQTTYSSLYSVIGTIPSFSAQYTTAFPTSMIGIAYSASLGLYVGISANSDGVVYISTDLENWSMANVTGFAGGSTFTNIAYCSGLGMFIATIGGNFGITSIDGYNWIVTYVHADKDTNAITQVACSSSTILLAGGSDTDNAIQYVWTSTDGTSWTRRALAVSGKTITAAHYSSALSLFVIGCSDGSIQTSPDGTTWTARTSNIASQINAFDSNSSLIVAVGNSGVISSSPTGATWTARTTQTSANLSGVAYCSSATNPWMACGASIIMTSTDGATWTTLTGSRTAGKNSIFYSPTDSKYIDVGAAALLATSTDLVSWTSQVSAEPTITFSTGAYGNGTYVIAGNLGKIDSSSNGVSWTARTANASSSTFSHVIYIAGSTNLFIACASSTIVTSPDGTTWTARTSNVASNLNAMAFKTGSDLIVAVGINGVITTSTNGISWTSRTSNTTRTLTGVAWNGTIFCAVGLTGTVVTSSDGTTWTKQAPTSFGTSDINWITSDGTNFFALCKETNGNIFIHISTDGINWTPYFCPVSFTGLNWMNSKLVGYSSNGDIATSTDGQAWTIAVNSRTTLTYNKAFCFNSKFYLTNGSCGASSSTDGVSFKGIYSPVINGLGYSASQNRLVGVGDLGTIITSTDDGSTWTKVYDMASVSGASGGSACAYSPTLDLFVATFQLSLATSSNGTTWIHRAFTNSRINESPTSARLTDITYSDSLVLFVVVGTAGLISTSSNGTTWTERTSNVTQTLNAICYNSNLGLFVAVGDNGTILTSSNGTAWTSRTNTNNGDLKSAATMEAKGFVALNTYGQMVYSPDGVTWTATSASSPGNITSVSKAIYSPVDSSVFFIPTGPLNTSSVTGIMFSTNDGKTLTTHPIIATSVNFTPQTFTGLIYIPSSDKIIASGISGSPFNLSGTAIMSRTYNKNTQFVLPILKNTWIKTT